MSPVDLRATAGPFQGSIVALPSPFMDGGLDVRSVSRLVEFHARFGSDALLLGRCHGRLCGSHRTRRYGEACGVCRARAVCGNRRRAAARHP